VRSAVALGNGEVDHIDPRRRTRGSPSAPDAERAVTNLIGPNGAGNPAFETEGGRRRQASASVGGAPSSGASQVSQVTLTWVTP
jgi:hypothetical protein